MKITFTLVGASFRTSADREQLRTAEIGDTVELEADPDNEYDAHAVRVLLNEHHIGFIPRWENTAIFRHIAQGGDYTAGIVSFLSVIKPTIEIIL